MPCRTYHNLSVHGTSITATLQNTKGQEGNAVAAGKLTEKSVGVEHNDGEALALTSEG